MNCRDSFAALVVFATAIATHAALSAATPAATASTAGVRTASVASERSFPAGSARTFRSFGVFSGPEENEAGDTEPDAVFIVPRRRFGPTPTGATASGATAGDRAPTDTSSRSGGGGGGASIPLREHPQVQAIVAEVLNFFRAREVNVALLGSHKYMINDCLGIKVSSGQFKLRFADPTLGFAGDKLVFECGIDHISFSAFKIKMRPRAPSFDDPNPCHFTKKFEIGGSADDVRLKVSFEPVVNNNTCRVALGEIDITVRIGDLNLKPLQNNLDHMGKNMVEDALSVYLDTAFVPDLFDRIEHLVQVGCGGSSDGSGDSSRGSSDSGNYADLERRVADLEAKVAALEAQPTSSASTSSAISPSPDRSSAAAPVTPRAEPAGAATARSAEPSGASAPGNLQTAGRANPRAAAPGGDGAFTIVANPELKGRLGRLIVEFPPGTKDLKVRTGTYKAGDGTELRGDYGDVVVELTPGAYDLVIGGRKVPGVVIQSRSDTRVRVGVLRMNGSKNTRFGIFAPGGNDELQALYGQNDVGLPVGSFEIEVNGQRETVTISAGSITDY